MGIDGKVDGCAVFFKVNRSVHVCLSLFSRPEVGTLVLPCAYLPPPAQNPAVGKICDRVQRGRCRDGARSNYHHQKQLPYGSFALSSSLYSRLTYRRQCGRLCCVAKMHEWTHGCLQDDQVSDALARLLKDNIAQVMVFETIPEHGGSFFEPMPQHMMWESLYVGEVCTHSVVRVDGSVLAALADLAGATCIVDVK